MAIGIIANLGSGGGDKIDSFINFLETNTSDWSTSTNDGCGYTFSVNNPNSITMQVRSTSASSASVLTARYNVPIKLNAYSKLYSSFTGTGWGTQIQISTNQITWTTLYSGDKGGGTISLADYAGQIVYLRLLQNAMYATETRTITQLGIGN